MAFVYEPRVRETSESELTGNIVLTGAMRGSLAFADVMTTDDECDIVISYGAAFEECAATLNAEGDLVRGTCYRSLHANGTVDTNHVSFGPGIKTVIMTVAAFRAHVLRGAPRVDVAQSWSDAEKQQARVNINAERAFATGTRAIFQQAS